MKNKEIEVPTTSDTPELTDILESNRVYYQNGAGLCQEVSSPQHPPQPGQGTYSVFHFPNPQV